MPGLAMSTVAVSEERIAAGLRQQHERKVFCAHRWFDGIVNLLLSDDFLHHRRSKPRFLPAIDRRRIVAMEGHLDRTLVGFSRALHDLSHPRFDQIERLCRESPNG